MLCEMNAFIRASAASAAANACGLAVQEEEFAKQLRLARYLAAGGSPPSRPVETVRQPRTRKQERPVVKGGQNQGENGCQESSGGRIGERKAACRTGGSQGADIRSKPRGEAAAFARSLEAQWSASPPLRPRCTTNCQEFPPRWI
jgi:hypothetical protein